MLSRTEVVFTHWTLVVVPAPVGFVSWVVLSARSGITEAWDAGGPYYALSFGLAFALGALVPAPPGRAALLGILFGIGQLVALVVTAEERTFLVLGLFIFAILCALFGVASSAGERLRERLRRPPAQDAGRAEDEG